MRYARLDMSIRIKMILIVMPIIAAAATVAGISASFLAQSGITRIAVEALGFKARELRQYSENQWALLEENDLTDDQEYIRAARRAISEYAGSLRQSDSELVAAFDYEGQAAFAVGLSTGESADPDDPIEPSGTEELRALIDEGRVGWIEFELAGVSRVGQSFFFDPLGWYMVVSDSRESFFREVDAINERTLVILGASVLAGLVLLLAFAAYLTKPLGRLVTTMRSIIDSGDMSQRVDIQFRDEIGTLGKTFNVMIGDLEEAYDTVKNYAKRAVIAQRNEAKIRNIFQKYVPQDVIDRYFADPESLLVGTNRELAILFTDIRNFTTIAESFEPEELVRTLNRYFEPLVDLIMEGGGIVDKYIGDAIMAFFGAPVSHDDDAARAVEVALSLRDAIDDFNRAQAERGLAEFRTGIGINFGQVLVGNIGSERKMDYTSIGDPVNLASRLEGLTKKYGTGMLFSEPVYEQARHRFPCRMIDLVQVKGKTEGARVYEARRSLGEGERAAWERYAAGLEKYYDRQFPAAERLFAAAAELLPGDKPAEIFLERSRRYMSSPPPAEWTGQEVMTEK
jgi:class 3 adenylate cyclase